MINDFAMISMSTILWPAYLPWTWMINFQIIGCKVLYLDHSLSLGSETFKSNTRSCWQNSIPEKSLVALPNISNSRWMEIMLFGNGISQNVQLLLSSNKRTSMAFILIPSHIIGKMFELHTSRYYFLLACQVKFLFIRIRHHKLAKNHARLSIQWR